MATSQSAAPAHRRPPQLVHSRRNLTRVAVGAVAPELAVLGSRHRGRAEHIGLGRRHDDGPRVADDAGDDEARRLARGRARRRDGEHVVVGKGRHHLARVVETERHRVRWASARCARDRRQGTGTRRGARRRRDSRPPTAAAEVVAACRGGGGAPPPPLPRDEPAPRLLPARCLGAESVTDLLEKSHHALCFLSLFSCGAARSRASFAGARPPREPRRRAPPPRSRRARCEAPRSGPPARPPR